MKNGVPIWTSVIEPSQYPGIRCWSAVVYRSGCKGNLRGSGWAFGTKRAAAKRDAWLISVGESP